MSDKKYLLTEEDFNGCDICKFCIGNGEDCHGDYLCTAIDEVLEPHEYHTLTCNPTDDGRCSECGEPLVRSGWGDCLEYANFCGECGAKVAER